MAESVFLEQCTAVNVNKFMIKFLQGSAVTQIMLGVLAVYPYFENYLQCVCAKDYKNELTVFSQVVAVINTIYRVAINLEYSEISLNMVNSGNSRVILCNLMEKL